jgi:hypothetical protein
VNIFVFSKLKAMQRLAADNLPAPARHSLDIYSKGDEKTGKTHLLAYAVFLFLV